MFLKTKYRYIRDPETYTAIEIALQKDGYQLIAAFIDVEISKTDAESERERLRSVGIYLIVTVETDLFIRIWARPVNASIPVPGSSHPTISPSPSSHPSSIPLAHQDQGSIHERPTLSSIRVRKPPAG